MSSRSNRASAGTFSDRPVERSSITHTVFPLARRRSTIWDPMKPAPPVTTTRDRRPEDSGAPLQAFVRPATARLAAMRPEFAAAAASSGEILWRALMDLARDRPAACRRQQARRRVASTQQELTVRHACLQVDLAEAAQRIRARERRAAAGAI